MSNQLTVAQILGAIQRHRTKAIMVWGGVMLAVVVLYLVWPRQYSSEGRLYVKTDRNLTSVVPTTSGNSIAIQDTRETEIRSVMEIIHSRAVLDRVVDEVGADEILRNGVFDWLPSLAALKPSGGSSGDLSAEEYRRLKKREQASKLLVESLDIYNEKKSSIIVVSVRSNGPRMAQRILESVFDNTRRIHLGIHEVSSSSEYFDDQFVEQEELVNDAVQELADFRNGLGVMTVGAALGSVQTIISTIDQDLVEADVALAESKERLSKLNLLMKKTPRLITMPRKGVERLSFEDSKTELFRLKQERARLRETVTSRDARYRTVNRQVAALERELGTMDSERTELESQPNPVFQTMETALKQTAVKLEGDKARLAALKREKAEANERLKVLNEAEVEANRRLRKLQVAQQYLAIYTQPRGESKAIGALDDRSISDVRIPQEPTLTLKHVNPKAAMVLPIGCLFGVLVALATVLFLDRNHLSATLNESEVEQALDLPVLVSLPRVYSSRNMVN